VAALLAGALLFGRTAGLLAAAIFGLAVLPIFYSHVAVNDVPSLAPVTLSLYGIAGVVRAGRMRDYLVAGVGIGLASATKCTGGITLLCLLVAFVCDAAGSSPSRAGKRLAAGLLAALAAFPVANPYAALDWNGF
jgi:4-amino-4-deoxy-L-arabinose transferase-like glycosyltransferase